MATKVNTKFVVGLLAVMLVAVAGVGFLAMRAFGASGDRQFAQGEAALVRYEQALAAGDETAARQAIREAASAFERAVGREPTRVDWLEQWQEALLKVTPTSPTDADRLYRWYRQIPRSLALLQPEDPERANFYLDLVWDDAGEGMFDIQNSEWFIEEVETVTRRLPESDPGTHRARAYKGKTIVRLMNLTSVDDQRREEALRLLQRAREAVPDDATVRSWEARWHLAEERRLRDARRTEDAQGALDTASQLIRDGLAALPESVDLRLEAITITQLELIRADRGDAVAEALRPLVRDLVELVGRMPTDAVDPQQAFAAAQSSLALGMREELDASTELLSSIAESRGNDPMAWLMLASLHDRRREYAQQMAAAERVLTMPEPTVGPDSTRMPVFRREAALSQADAALALWETAQSAEDRSRYERLSREKVDLLAARVESTRTYLLSDRRGRVALLSGKPNEALAPLAEAVRGYEAAGEAAPIATLRNLAEALGQTNNPGEARRVWERVVDRQLAIGRDDPLARLRIGALSADLREYQTALEQFQRAAEILGPENDAMAQFAIGSLYETLLERGETISLPGRGALTEEQMIAEATGIFEKIRASSPDNEQVNRALERLASRSGRGGDPEMTAAIAAQQAFEAGNIEQALRVVETAIEAGHGSPRLWLMRVDALNRSGQAEQAREAIEQAAAMYPENADIERFRRIAVAEDPEEAVLAGIEDPLQRAFVRRQMAANRNDQAAMDAALNEARAIDPENLTILDLDFDQAIQRRDWDRANALSRRAGEKNADQVGGLLYQGRLLHARGEFTDAVRTLRQAVEQLEFNPVAWRWLGLSQLRLGQTGEAVESLARAVQSRPSDINIARDYASALVRAGRGPEALAAIDDKTGVLRFGQRSPEIVELWLDLAVQFGGPEGRETALRERRAIYARNPSDTANAAQLVLTLFDAEKWDEAAGIIDALGKSANADPMGVAGLRARWLQRQGRVEEAVNSFASYLAADPALLDSVRGQLAFGNLLLEFGQPDLALQRFERADELSEPGQTVAARQIAALYAQAGFQSIQTANQFAAVGQAEQAEAIREQASNYLGQALERYERVLAALDPQTSPEEHTQIGLQMVEAQLALDRMSEAEQTLGTLTALAANDLRRSILRALIASGQGDARRARQIMDEAVRDHPNDAAAFLNRARITASDNTLLLDTLADLDRATSLQPANIEAWQLRVELLRARGEMDRAVASLRSAIRLNPNQDALKDYLIQTLRSSGRTAEAADEAILLADARPRSVDVQVRTVNLLQQVGRWNDAVRLLSRLRELEPNNPTLAASWLESQLNAGTRLTPAQATPVLRVVRSAPAYGTPSEPIAWANAEARTTHALRQVAQAARDEALARRYFDESRNALARGLRLIGENPNAASAWLTTANQVIGSGPDAIAFARAGLGDQPLPPMLRVMELGIRLMGSGGDQAEALAVLDAAESLLSEYGDNPVLRMELLRTRGFAATQAGEHTRAVEAFEAILQSNPNDPLSLNNLAYILATELRQPERGLEYAQRAAALSPENSTVLDTLGAVFLAFDPPRFDEAEPILRRAITFARTPDQLFPANVHLAQTLLGQERTAQARAALEAARRAMPDADPTLRRTYEPQIAALEAALQR